MEEMCRLREMLNKENIDWNDVSEGGNLPITRTHFWLKGNLWSVIHGYGTFGGWTFTSEDEGLLELMTDAIPPGEPLGFLTAEQVMTFVMEELKK